MLLPPVESKAVLLKYLALPEPGEVLPSAYGSQVSWQPSLLLDHQLAWMLDPDIEAVCGQAQTLRDFLDGKASFGDLFDCSFLQLEGKLWLAHRHFLLV